MVLGGASNPHDLRGTEVEAVGPCQQQVPLTGVHLLIHERQRPGREKQGRSCVSGTGLPHLRAGERGASSELAHAMGNDVFYILDVAVGASVG